MSPEVIMARAVITVPRIITVYGMFISDGFSIESVCHVELARVDTLS